jgi:hypothetical protein
LNLAVGIEYARRLDRKNGLLASVTFVPLIYAFGDKERFGGDVVYRTLYLMALSYRRRLLAVDALSVDGFLGVNFRAGHESVLLAVYGREAVYHSYPLRDWGLSAGCRGSYALHPRLELGAQLKMTTYLIRYGKLRDDPFDFPNRPTRNMLTLQLGLGYRW